jgi:ABC-2 type transport system ATP-binding protein
MLELQSIYKNYSGKTALHDINLFIKPGRVFGLLGPNGAGKTSLIRIINRIIFQDSGKIIWKNNVVNEGFTELIGYLPEERGLYRKMKIFEQVVFIGRLKSGNKKDIIESADYWFKRFNIESWKNKLPSELSKGMQQKIQFLISIIHNPQIVILDEPLSGFDPVNAFEIKKVIVELKKLGKTIIIATHDMNSVEELCDDIALVNNAKIVLSGDKNKIIDSYKEGYFEIETLFEIQNNDVFKVMSYEKVVSSFKSIIKSDKGINAIVKSLPEHNTIYSIKEMKPGMESIFISTVKEKNV